MSQLNLGNIFGAKLPDVEDASVKLTTDAKGKSNLKPKVGVYAKSPEQLGQQTFPEISKKFSSVEGLQKIFTTMDDLMTKGSEPDRATDAKFSTAFHQAWIAMEDQNVGAILTEDALKVWFSAVVRDRKVKDGGNDNKSGLEFADLQRAQKSSAKEASLFGDSLL